MCLFYFSLFAWLQAKHIEEVCKAGENINKVSEDKIIQKMENALKNREEYYRALQERLKEHVRIHNSSFASNFIVLCVLYFLNMSSTTRVVSQFNTRNDGHLYVIDMLW